MLTLDAISKIELQAADKNTPESWADAVHALETYYRTYPNDVEVMLRLGHLYWYLVEGVGVYNCTLDYNEMTQSLQALYSHAKVILKDNVDFLWSFAYMRGLGWYYFEPDCNEDPREINLSMYEYALELEPHNPLPIMAGWGAGLFRDLDPSIMESHCQNAILQLYAHKMFNKRGLWGDYFKNAIESNIMGCLELNSNNYTNTVAEFDSYVQQVIDSAKK